MILDKRTLPYEKKWKFSKLLRITLKTNNRNKYTGELPTERTRSADFPFYRITFYCVDNYKLLLLEKKSTVFIIKFRKKATLVTCLVF